MRGHKKADSETGRLRRALSGLYRLGPISRAETQRLGFGGGGAAEDSVEMAIGI